MLKSASASASVAVCLLAGLTVAQAQPAPAPSAPPAPDAIEQLPPPADCTFTKVFVCEAEKGCSTAPELGTIDLPARFLVHYAKQIIASTNDDGLPYVSSIQALSSSGDNITLQGADGLVGWIMQLSRSEPGATLTTVSHESVLTAFGTCKPAP